MKRTSRGPGILAVALATLSQACPSRSTSSAPAPAANHGASPSQPGGGAPSGTAARATDAGTRALADRGGAAPPDAGRAAREGVLMMYANGSAIGRERFRDDGTTLTTRVVVLTSGVEVSIDRSTRHVRVRQGPHGEQRSEHDLPPNSMVLENGAWSPFAIAAEWFAAATQPTSVHVYLASQDTTADGIITVRAGAAGARTVELTLGPQTMTVDVSAEGVVTHAAVPAQHVEVRPESAGRPAVTYAPAPAGITEEALEVDRNGVTIRGALWRPAGTAGPVPVVVLVAGSGPTDREGNSILNLSTNCYRMLAEALARRGVASVRFDKRGVGASGTNYDPRSVTFDDVVADAQAFVERVRGDARFSQVTVAGHSEGGLIALRVAERVPVQAVVLIASVGRPFGVLLREQFARDSTPAQMAEFDRVMTEIRAGRPTDSTIEPIRSTVNPALNGTYMHGEVDLDPAAILHGLHMPAVIIQGDTDVQVQLSDARALAAARPDARLVVLPHVNHVLKVEASVGPDQASYHDGTLPLAPGVVDAVYSGIAGAQPQPAATAGSAPPAVAAPPAGASSAPRP